jgi:FixJ family two-component response regulator
MGDFDSILRNGTGFRQPIVTLIGVVDDDESVRDALSSLVRSAGYQCAVFSSAEDFLASGPPETDCLVLDIRMPGLSGFELHRRMRELNLQVPVIFITGQADDEMRLRALGQGAAALLGKPFNDEVLLGTIHSAMQNGSERSALS